MTEKKMISKDCYALSKGNSEVALFVHVSASESGLEETMNEHLRRIGALPLQKQHCSVHDLNRNSLFKWLRFEKD